MEAGVNAVDVSPGCGEPVENDDDVVEGTLIDNAKLSGCVDDDRTRKVPKGSFWVSGNSADNNSFTISL